MNAFAILTGGKRPNKIKARQVIHSRSDRREVLKRAGRKYEKSEKGKLRHLRWREKNRELLRIVARIQYIERHGYKRKDHELGSD